jgi:hypothetical protein
MARTWVSANIPPGAMLSLSRRCAAPAHLRELPVVPTRSLVLSGESLSPQRIVSERVHMATAPRAFTSPVAFEDPYAGDQAHAPDAQAAQSGDEAALIASCPPGGAHDGARPPTTRGYPSACASNVRVRAEFPHEPSGSGDAIAKPAHCCKAARTKGRPAAMARGNDERGLIVPVPSSQSQGTSAVHAALSAIA